MDLAALYGLQVVDTAIEQAEHARPRLPEIVQHSAGLAELKAVRSDIENVRRQQQSAQDELDRIERESSEIDAQRAKFEKQLKTIISPREAEALQHEMQSLAAHRNELDDRGIELLEASSAADEEIVALVDREGRAVAAESVLLEQRQRAEVEADRVLADLRAKRIEIAAVIAPTDLVDYERRRASFGGIAVSRIEHGMCTGCRMDISIAELDSIKRQPAEINVECPNCNRFLLR
ncbi:MAG: hypothetical protein RL391_55 [Actinomycetota bacterium]|jgi:predicted  nucleic acid-binding Zn-ribbon protein